MLEFVLVVIHLKCGYNSKEDIHLENINDSEKVNNEQLCDFETLNKQDAIINAEAKAKE